ncbi:MAG TPA: hypothetical protein VK638_48045 [Edaphobacter sp.]|nr:hypothetical protein [Edaphobacter sp.]
MGALHPAFIRGIEEELDKGPSGTFHGLYGTDDPDLRNLLLLLVKESETGGRCGTLYAESLIAALATRLLYAARLEKLPVKATVSPLPRRQLRRVLERMQADLSANLNLAMLAAESGYSRAHFLRTPSGDGTDATSLSDGTTSSQGSSLDFQKIDAADRYSCGLWFLQSRSPTTAFRSRFGLSPSTYRRGL